MSKVHLSALKRMLFTSVLQPQSSIKNTDLLKIAAKFWKP